MPRPRVEVDLRFVRGWTIGQARSNPRFRWAEADTVLDRELMIMIDVPGSGTTTIDGAEVVLRRHDDLDPRLVSRVAIVGVIPFTPTGEIVAVDVRRGIDIPSGHVEDHDPSLEDAARRESREEAGLTLGPLAFVACFGLVDGGDPEAERYVAVYAAMVVEMDDFRPNAEVRDRLVLTPAELFARYRQGDVALFRRLVAEGARKLDLGPLPG